MNGVELRIVLDDAQFDALAARVLDRIPTPPTEEPWPEWMSAATAARYLDVTVERIQKLKSRNSIPYYQDGPGCRVFFRRPELDAWMDSFRVEHRGGDA